MENGAVAYKCPHCNAGLTFNAKSGGFDCEYCGGHFTQAELDSISASSIEAIDGDISQEELSSVEKDLERISKEELTEEEKYSDHPKNEEEIRHFTEDNRLYLCPTCGAAVITESELSATAICHYCHSPIVLSGRLQGDFCPDMIIPFKQTKEDALRGFQEWTKKFKFFLAKGFGSPDSLSKIQGIYVPFWLTDCITEGTLVADGYKHISSVRSGDYIVNTEKKYTVVRQGTLEFSKIPADGSLKADDALMESIEPFNYNDLVDFKMSYLSGHNAEKYDVTKEQVYPRINKRAVDQTRVEFNDSVKGYSRKVVRNEAYRVKGVRWKYVMLPLWFLSFKYKNKYYYYAMNGQTGKFGGTLPLNNLKLALFSFGIPIAVAAAFAILFILFGG